MQLSNVICNGDSTRSTIGKAENGENDDVGHCKKGEWTKSKTRVLEKTIVELDKLKEQLREARMQQRLGRM